MSSVDYSIDIVTLGKRFKRRTLKRSGYTTIKSAILQGVKAWATGEETGSYTEAIKDLTIRVPRGASMGVIGQNGSGKSTLLKLITGIYKPDTGHVSVNGRIAALIELGAGFHPDFTGRENLLLGGVMHGLSRSQLEHRLDEIVEFAELRDVIDDPVRTYSSGMFMRLGFSLAVHTDPDVLLIDEVLAVGDASFVSRCKERITRLRREGKTLLLVSHDLSAIERWCDEALWLHKGVAKDRGDPRRVIDHYREFIEHGEESELREQSKEKREEDVPTASPVEQPAAAATAPQRWGSREVEITSIRFAGSQAGQQLMYHPEDPLDVEVHFTIRDQALLSSEELVFGIGFTRTDGVLVHGSNTDIENIPVRISGSEGRVRYHVPRLGLLEGNYFLDVAVHRKDGYPYDYHKNSCEFAVRSGLKQVGVCVPPHTWEITSA